MTKEECMKHFINTKGSCDKPFNLSCEMDNCYFAGSHSTTDDCYCNCYCNRFNRFFDKSEFRYRFAVHYFDRKIKKIKEILQ